MELVFFCLNEIYLAYNFISLNEKIVDLQGYK